MMIRIEITIHNLNKEESDLRAFTNNKKQSEYKY